MRRAFPSLADPQVQSPASGGGVFAGGSSGVILYQSFALAMIYGGEARQAYFLARLAARSVQFAITGVLDVLVVWLLQRSGALRAVGLPPVQSKGNDDA